MNRLIQFAKLGMDELQFHYSLAERSVYKYKTTLVCTTPGSVVKCTFVAVLLSAVERRPTKHLHLTSKPIKKYNLSSAVILWYQTNHVTDCTVFKQYPLFSCDGMFLGGVNFK